jgi:beta-glucanase (GH16 family)
LLVAVLVGMALLVPVASAAAATPPAVTRLDPPTWADEFDGPALDLTRWNNRATGPRHDGFLTPDAVSVDGGALRIRTYTEGGQHFSGMIGTQANGPAGFQQAYGLFEARVRFNSAPGQWSAFWLQSPTIGNPIGDPATAGVEMDIVEHRVRCVEAPAPTPPATCGPASDISDRAQHALIWDGYGPESKAAVKLSDPLAGLGNGSWHTWALGWTPDELTVYYDDAAVWTITGPISRRSQYIVLSSEVGAFFAGAIPPGGYGSRATSTTDMQVDYVRVWSFAPAATAPPAIAGVPLAGQPLTCSPGTWRGDPAPAFAYAWHSDGAPIAGAVTSTYTVAAGDVGHALSCRVTATNSAGSADADSAPVAVLAAPPPLARLVAAPLPRPPLPPPPAVVVVDRIAPRVLLSGSRAQRLGRTMSVTAACPDEVCRATATATVRTHRLAAPTAVIARGSRATFRLRLSTRTRAAVRRALRAHRRVVAEVSVRAVDAAGNARVLTRRVTLRP